MPKSAIGGSGYSFNSTGPSSGAVTLVTSGMSPYTILSTDYELHCDTSGGSISLLYPQVSANRKRRIIASKVTLDANTVTLVRFAGDTMLAAAADLVLAGLTVGVFRLTAGIGASNDWRGW